MKYWNIPPGNKLPKDFNKKLAKERLARVKINLSKSSLWSGHCKLVFAGGDLSKCKDANSDAFKKFNKEISYFPNETGASDTCKSLIQDIKKEKDPFKKLTLRKELGRKCVNWCANLTKKDKTIFVRKVVEEYEDSSRVHRCDAWWSIKTTGQQQISEGEVCEQLVLNGLNPLGSFDLEAKLLTGAFALATYRGITEEGGGNDEAKGSLVRKPFSFVLEGDTHSFCAWRLLGVPRCKL